METRVRASPEQFSTLLEYMETHGDLARPLAGAQGRIRSDQLWTDLTNILNAAGGGVSKTTEKWKKVWADWKSKTKKKALAIKHHASGTGGGPASRQTLSASDRRVLGIMGALAVAGQDSVEELGFNRSINTTQGDPAAQDDSVIQDYLEIVDEPSTSQSSNNWLPVSLSYQIEPPPLPLVLTETSAQGRQPVAPAPPATSAPAAPSPPAQSPPTPAVPTTTRRRPRLRSPATPQSTAASPNRPLLRARRRRAPTPFERAASEFTAVELRRLELEEARIRLQHERDMRALEIEHERNQVFSSLVNVAQAWLDYYRSRDNTEPLYNE